MYANSKPIFKQSIASCSSDNCDCCDVYYSSDDDELTESYSSSLTSTASSTDSLCSCDTNQQINKDSKLELSWIDHFTDRYGRVSYIKFLDECSEPKSKQPKTGAQKKFKKR